jgi:tryptophan-rich sensory protein
MNGGMIWAIIAVVAVVGGWLSYSAARKAGKASATGFLIAFLVVFALIVVLSLIATYLQSQ